MYKKKLMLVLMLLVASTGLIAFAALSAEKYVTDDLSIYLRRGPGTQYGLTGSLKSGDKVTVVEFSSDSKYTRVKDDRGRVAWIESSMLTDTPSLKEQLPALQQEIALLQEKVNSADQTKQEIIDSYTNQLDMANQKIADLEKTKNELQLTNEEQAKELESLTNQVDEKRQDLMLTWFTRGGLIAGLGLVLGLVLPLIIPRRRKKDRWMN